MKVYSFKSTFIKTNGVKLHCVIEGKGETVILLHGFPEFWYAWRKTIPFLAKQDFKVVAPDLRGYNKSEAPEGVKNYSIDVLVEDIKGLIDHIDSNKKAYVVGHDWGGFIAWALAMKYPETVEKLFILNCPHPQDFRSALKRNIFQIFKSYYMGMFKVPNLPEWFIGRNLKRFFTKTLQKGTRPKNIITDDEIDKYVNAFSDRKNLTASIDYYRAIGFRTSKEHKVNEKEETTNQAETKKLVNEIKPTIFCPVSILWGCKDKYIGRELIFNVQQHCTVRPDVEYIQDATHWIHHEKPELVNNTILRFFKRKHLTVDFNAPKKVGFGEDKEKLGLDE